jgi:uncharacterized membrane protein
LGRRCRLLLHLLANGVWLGGPFALALVVLPALRRRPPAERRTYLAASIPAFSVPALAAVALVTLTGPLTATTRLTSLQQVWTTPYGLVLIAKSGLFLLMVAISYRHAFRLRPRLAALRASAQPAAAAGTTAEGSAWRHWTSPHPSGVSRLPAFAHAPGGPGLEPRPDGRGPLALATPAPGGPQHTQGGGGEEERREDRLARAITAWLQIEACVGLAVLLCAALLGPLAGSPPTAAATPASLGASGGAQTLTQQADSLTVTLGVAPGKFGTNTFSVVVKNPNGSSATAGTVFLISSNVEVDVGTTTINLTPANAPGTYTGQGVLSMAGHWRLRTVIRTREDPTQLHTTTFTISASY